MDPSVRQLENSIIAERRERQLRVISVESLLSLAEMKNQYDVTHEDILNILRPSKPNVDPIIDVMMRLAAPPEEEIIEEREKIAEIPKEEVNYFLAPVKSEENVRVLVGGENIWAFGNRTPYRGLIKPGDWICFYVSGKGVVAHARIASSPERGEHPKIREQEKYPWVFKLNNVKLYLDDPVILDAELRSKLEVFKNRDQKTWGWFVHRPQKISKHDFKTLTKQ